MDQVAHSWSSQEGDLSLGPAPEPLQTARETALKSPVATSPSGSATARAPGKPAKAAMASPAVKGSLARGRERRGSPVGEKKEARGAHASLKGSPQWCGCWEAPRLIVMVYAGARPTNEDWHAQGDTNCGQYSVLLLCDGHGGAQTAAVAATTPLRL